MRGVRPVAMRFERRPRRDRASASARPGRARRARSRPRRPRTARGPSPPRGPKPRAAPRSSSFARARSPSCAIAMPRSASAGGSSRSATRFSAASGSPAASARAAAVISESIEIPSHLSLSPGSAPRPTLPLGPATAGRRRQWEPEDDHVLGSEQGKRSGWQARGAAGWLALAASPTFALMACDRGAATRPRSRSAPRRSGLLPIDGMTAMYLLMSLFHLPPWLKLASGAPGRRA